MPRYIDADLILPAMESKLDMQELYLPVHFQELIMDEIPTADVVPIHHGHWIEEYDCGYIAPHCSECGETALTKEETSYDYVYSSYCPRCGARMDGDRDD